MNRELTTQIVVRVDADLRTAIERDAAENERTTAQSVRFILRNVLLNGQTQEYIVTYRCEQGHDHDVGPTTKLRPVVECGCGQLAKRIGTRYAT